MLCPSCDKEIQVEKSKETRIFKVKKEDVAIEDNFYRCQYCEEEWSIEGFDSMLEAYRVYRERHNMVQPNELKSWRKHLHLTQEELSKLLGWSESTVVRYENGALQEQSHDNQIRMAMTDEGLQALLDKNPNIISEKKREFIESKIRSRFFFDPKSEIESIFKSEEQSILTGYHNCIPSKLVESIAILTSNLNGAWKTTLNKLLWYADFFHFKENAVGITGLKYQHFKYGPVPNNWDCINFVLPKDEFEFIVEDFPNGASGERICTIKQPDYSLFIQSEIEILIKVRDVLGCKGASEISNLSHRESGWINTKLNEVISYQWANELNELN